MRLDGADGGRGMSGTGRNMRVAAWVTACVVGVSWTGCNDGSGGTAPPDGGDRYAADTQIVRRTLDTNGLTTVPLENVAAVADGRVGSLDLSHRGLAVVPAAVGGLDALHALYLHDNLLTNLPDSITRLCGLSTLTIGGNRLCEPSPAVCAWLDEYVTLAGWRERQRCGDHATDSAVVRAILDANGLSDVGVDEVCDTTSLGRIGRLLLAHRALYVLPADIGGLDDLETLDLHDNRLTDLPDTLTTLPALTAVDIEYNHLCSLSTSLAAWADSLAPGWRAFQDCSTGVRDTALFAAGSVDSIAEGDERWLAIETGVDSLVIDSITVVLDSTMPPRRVSFRPIGVPAYTATADTACLILSHGASYGDDSGSAVIAVPPHSTAYLVGIDIQTCVGCSADADIPPIRDGDTLRADLRFSYRRCESDSIFAGTSIVTVTGTMDTETIGDRTPVRQWFMEIYSKDPPYETVDFDAMPDTCESYLDTHNDDSPDVAFSPESLAAHAGIKHLGAVDTSGRLLLCREVDSVAAVVAVERYAFVQAGFMPKVPLVDGGVYWVHTADGAKVLLVHTYSRRGAYDRYQFLWAHYE